MKLLLFDIDGTLLLTGGAGLRGMARAFEQVFGVPDALDGVPVAGRTDPTILADVMARTGVTGTAEHRQQFQEVYLPILAEEMGRPPSAEGRLPGHGGHNGPLPGVPELVQALTSREDTFLALLTGNYTKAAEIKLGYYDLWKPFRCGAYGDDAEQRHELVPIAVGRARARGCPPVGPRDVIVIGDTPLDVDCATRAGVRSLAVATGGYSRDTLVRAGADHVVDTLEDTGAMVEWLTGNQ